MRALLVVVAAALAVVLVGCEAVRSASGEREEHGEHEGGEHGEHEEHGEHGEHGEHEEHGEGHAHEALPTRVVLSERVIAAAGIVTSPAQRQVVAPVLIAPGHVEADPGRVAQVPAKVAGIVEAVMFREGDQVEAGQVMATVRAPGLGGLRADLAALQARKAAASSNLARLEALAAKNMASVQEVAAARAEAAALDAEASAARQRLAALGLASKGRATLISLRAPVSGFVTQRGVVPGQTLTPEAMVATIVSLDRAWFVARIFEHMIARVKVGAVAEVTLNAHPDHPFHGVVEYLAPMVDQEAQTVVARIPIDNREALLRLGLFGDARIAAADPLAASAPVLAVPREALIEVAGKTVVFVGGEGGSFEVHEVVLGAEGPGVVEVLQGLHEGEAIVTRGAWTLKSVLLKGTFGEDHGH